MKIKVTSLTTILVLLSSTAMLVLTGFLGIEVTRLCLYAIVACLLVELIFLKIPLSYLFCLITLIVSAFITNYFYGGNVANTLIFTTSIIFAMRIQREGFAPIEWACLKFCTYAVVLSYFAMYFINPQWTAYGQLLLIFDNPNMAGIACCAPAVVLVLIAMENRGKSGNFINWLMVFMCAYLVYCTENRGSFFTLLAIIAVTLFDVVPKKGKRITSPLVYTILRLTPIIMLFLYVTLYDLLPHDIVILDKPLFSGREYSWKIAIENFISNPFSHQVFEEGTLNLVLEGIVRYGLIAMTCFFIFLFLVKRKDLAECPSLNYIAYAAFFLCLFQQCFESTMITGSYSVYIWTYSLLGVAFMKPKEEFGTV